MVAAFPFLISIFVLTTVPVLFGAVQPWVWSVYAVVIFAGFGWVCLQSQSELSRQNLTAVPVLAVGIFLFSTLLQLFPLSTDLMVSAGSYRPAILRSSNRLLDLFFDPAAISYNVQRSFSWWLFLFSLVLFFLVLRRILTRPRIVTLLWLMFAVAALEALYGVMQALIPNMGVLWVDYIQACLGDARGTYINRNHFAGYMEMMIPLMLGFSLSREDWNSKVGWRTFFASDHPHLQFLMSLGLVLMVLALLFSKSRAGILAFVIGLAMFLYLIRSGRKAMPLSVKTTFLVISGLVLFYGLQIGFESTFERFLQISPEASRLDFWRDSLAVIAAHPLGTGLGTFELVFAVHNVSTTLDGRISHLHNDYLQLLLETGWVGFLSLLAGFGWFLITGIRRVKSMSITQSPLRFFIAAGALSGLISMAFHALFDFNLQIPANCVYFVSLMALVNVCTRPGAEFEAGAEEVAPDSIAPNK